MCWIKFSTLSIFHTLKETKKWPSSIPRKGDDELKDQGRKCLSKFFQKTLKEQNFIDASTFREPRLLIKKIFSSTNIPSTFRGCKKKICCKWNSEVNWMKYDYNEKVFAFCYTEYLVRTTRSKRLNIDLINLLNWLRCELLS